MKLHTAIRLAYRSKKYTLSGKFKLNIPLSDVGKYQAKPFQLTLIAGQDKRITFNVPHTKNLGEHDENSLHRKALVIKDISEKNILLHWAPAGQSSERGFDVALSFKKQSEGTFNLQIRLPDTFTIWEDQTKNPRGVVDPDYAI